MNTIASTFFENYTPVGDILVLAICLAFVILIDAAYVSRTRAFHIYRIMLALLALAAVTDLCFYVAAFQPGAVSRALLYVLRVAFHAALFGNLFLYVFYIAEIMHLSRSEQRKYVIVGALGYAAMGLYEALGIVLHYGFYIDEEAGIHTGFPVFPFAYIFFVGLILFMALCFRERVYKQIVFGVIKTSVISFAVLLIQGLRGQNSFTTATFVFPMLALLYLVHSSPYDLDIGAVSAAGFEDSIRYHYQNGQELLIMSLFLPELEGSGRKYPEGLTKTIRYFATCFFSEAVMFQTSGGRMILVMETSKNPNHEDTVRAILEKFREAHDKYRMEHKIVIILSIDQISAQNDYIGLIQYVESRMPENSIHTLVPQDVERYLEHRRVLAQLSDIFTKRDMDDERIEVYCQPVLNLRTRRYDTAEALMRLRLGDKLVLPDYFIPLAEQHGFITALSEIILSKTCRRIKALLDDGYHVERISVNFSMLDLRNPEFSSRVSNIIRKSGIPCEKIAIELTESQNERDFMVVKERISELHESGIKFYLDDFGTGYSNFERIMELPFDIIKFDRSLVIASATDPESKTMVSNLARMFRDMGYAVLYEGVETEDDERRCGEMSARYLQGNRYSAPIPIEALAEFFDHAGE